MSSSFIGPQIRGRWIQPTGFFTAVDLAWGFPLSFTSEATPDASGKTLDFKQNAEKCLQHGVPLLGLVSFGYLFSAPARPARASPARVDRQGRSERDRDRGTGRASWERCSP